MNIRGSALLVLVIGLSMMAGACSNSATSPADVASLTVTGTSPAVGGTSQLNATATLASGATQDVTAQATWSSSNTAVAIVSATGLVTGIASGSATVQASYQSMTGSEAIALP
ncbi:MAG: hypothetical protein QOJ79_3 [Actinomycetota bacterium]|nr:hypothetical protein [Actinomycetota bacterium]